MTIYKRLSAERKQAQADGNCPQWLTTGGYQLLKDKYLDGQTVLSRFEEIALTAASHMEKDSEYWADKFFELLWNGWLAPSTPVMANMGRPEKGMPVSCSGNYVEDSIDGFYAAYSEVATLTKHGFGTSSYLGAVRPRGSHIRSGGKASGVIDVITSFVDDMRKVSQGTSRRGAWAGYVDLNGGDFHEVCDYLEANPDDLNIGWNVYDEDLLLLEESFDTAERDELVARLSKAMKVKLVTGKGYFFFPDKVNRANPNYMERVYASNLCTEITLPANKDLTFTCVLSSMNLSKYDEWKDTDAVQTAIQFLNCVASEFIYLSKGIPNMKKAHDYTKKYRSLGLGALGFHTLLQQRSLAYGSTQSMLLNAEVFHHLKEQALLAETGFENSHLLAIAPNTSSALICGGVSQGIEPVVANIYNQQTAAGDIYRVNPVFLELAKERGKFTDELVDDLIYNTAGSVQHLDWLSDHEKEVFRTAYEIDQAALVRMAAARQQQICQGQSLNLFFPAKADEEEIMRVHQEAFRNENIKALYYLRTAAGVQGASECVACEG